MTDETKSRPARREESGRTSFAWHFAKLMGRLEEILQALKGIETAVVRTDEFRPRE